VVLRGLLTFGELSVSLSRCLLQKWHRLQLSYIILCFFFEALKYKSSHTNKRIILLLVAGLVLTVIVVVGAILLIPGKMHGYQDPGWGLR
jgi:hypothetical protein